MDGSNSTLAASDLHPYASHDYWEERYVARDRDGKPTFEWYAGLGALGHLILAGLPDCGMRILHVGNGSSRLPEDLYALGYHDQVANDVSPSVVAQMAKRVGSACPGLQFAVEDALAMDHAACTFDAVIDKGTCDAIECAGPAAAIQLHQEVRRVLRPGGVYVLITWSDNSAPLMLGPPRWRKGEWRVKTNEHTSAVSGSTWVHCATKVELAQLSTKVQTSA